MTLVRITPHCSCHLVTTCASCLMSSRVGDKIFRYQLLSDRTAPSMQSKQDIVSIVSYIIITVSTISAVTHWLMEVYILHNCHCQGQSFSYFLYFSPCATYLLNLQVHNM